MTVKQISTQIAAWHRQGKKVVLVTGVFDLLHIEHIRFLTKAKAAGDKLIVGLESDARVRQIKGHERPVNSQNIRLSQATALKPVDLVFILPESFNTQADWENLLLNLKPDIYAVSSHTSYLKNKQHICTKFGIGFRIVHRFNPNYSTSRIFEKLTQDL